MRKILIVFLTFIMLSTVVYAESQNIFYLEKKSDIVVTLQWENETPDVTLLSPDGKKINITKGYNNDDKKITYPIKSAAKGQWGVKYDKKDNEYIDLFHNEYSEASDNNKLNKNILVVTGLLSLLSTIIFVVIVGVIYHSLKVKKNKDI